MWRKSSAEISCGCSRKWNASAFGSERQPGAARDQHQARGGVDAARERRALRQRSEASCEPAVAGEDEEFEDRRRQAEDQHLPADRLVRRDEQRKKRGEENQRFRIRGLQQKPAAEQARSANVARLRGSAGE